MLVLVFAVYPGADSPQADTAKPVLAWGQKGDKAGEFYSPIGIAISAADEVFVNADNGGVLMAAIAGDRSKSRPLATPPLRD